jgi:hypothetical protein
VAVNHLVAGSNPAAGAIFILKQPPQNQMVAANASAFFGDVESVKTAHL